MLKEQFIQLIESQKIPQAQLISGPQGSALLPLSLAFATYLQCLQKTNKGACRRCSSCMKAEKYVHPDIYFAFPLGSTASSQSSPKVSPTISNLPAWRSFLAGDPYQDLQGWATHLGQPSKQMKINTIQIEEIISFLRMHPIESPYKIVFLWLPEHIHPPIAHKILKTLEEPPVNGIFLLVSHDVSQILPTIISRTWSLKIPPFQDDEIRQALAQKYPNTSAANLSQITQMARGNLPLASQLASEENTPHFDALANWLRSTYRQNWSHIVEETDRFHKSTPTVQKQFILYALHLMRLTLMSKYPIHKSETSFSKEVLFCQNFGRTISFQQLQKIIRALEVMYAKLARNAHPKLLFLTTSLSIAGYFNKAK